MSSDDLLPWFSPRLSPAVSRVITNLGRRAELQRGQTLNSSAFFKRLVYIKNGFLAQGVINSGASAPFMLTLSGPGSLGVTAGVVDSIDTLSRRFWAATHCEVLTLRPEILLRLSEVDESLNRELSSYAMRHMMSERMGLMVCQAASAEERLGVFIVSILTAQGMFSADREVSKSCWVPLSVLPSRKLVQAILALSEPQLKDVLKKWLGDNIIRWSAGSFHVRGDVLAHYWQWMQPFVRMHAALTPAAHDVRYLDRLELDLNH